MEAKPSSVVDNFKGLVRSSEDFFKSTIKKSLDKNGQNYSQLVLTQTPVILKRFQKEAFSELMKLRDKQEKLEKMLLYQKYSTGSPFQQARTYIKTAFSVIGSLLVFEDDFLDSADRLERSGIRTGVNSKLTFETVIRDRDSLVAEFGKVQSGPFGLNRLTYHASINDLFSLVVVPVGAQCCNFRMNSSSSQGQNDDLHVGGCPIFRQVHDCAAGVTLRGFNFGASLAQLVLGPPMENGTSNTDNCHFTTFSQITYKPLQDLKISLSSLWQMRRSSSHLVRISKLTVPVFQLKRSRESEVQIEVGHGTDTSTGTPHSVAVMVEGEYLESAKLEGWVEVDGPMNENLMKFGVSLSDMPENKLGWGLRVSGAGKRSLLKVERFQMEGFLNVDLGSGGNAKLQPGLVYVTGGGSRTVALLLRSSWSM